MAWIRSALALPLALLFAPVGCGRRPAEARDVDAPGTVAEGVSVATEVSLLDRFLVAEVHAARVEMSFAGPDEEPWTRWGWHQPDEDGTWTYGRVAVLEIPRLQPGPLRLQIHLTALESDGDKALPRQKVRLLWNEKELGSWAVKPDSEPHTFKVPPDWQVTGLNQLRILPSYWLTLEKGRRTYKEDGVGVRCESLQLLPAKEELVGGACNLEDGVLIQPCGRLVTCSLFPPESARLVGRLRLRSPLDSLPEGIVGQLVVRAECADGSASKTLFQRSLAACFESREAELDVDLSDLGTDAVSFHLALSVRGEEGLDPARADLFAVEWHELKVVGHERQSPHHSPRRPGASGHVPVLVVLFDSLRAEYMALYGGRGQTPHTSALAGRGVRMLEASSVTSWTRPSVASLFTGQHPDVHQCAESGSLLTEEVPSLASLLHENGYRTLSVVHNGQVAPELGFQRGFDQAHTLYDKRVEYLASDAPEGRATMVWDTMVQPFLDQGKEDEPVFFYLHEIDPHAPYEAPDPFRDMYVEGGHLNHSAAKAVCELMNSGVMPLSEVDVEYLRAQYQAEITFMDRYLGEILRRWEGEFGRESLVVFLSDHGEEFLDHGGVRHGRTLYEELTHIPLVFSYPGVLPEGEECPVPASIVDVAPTVLELVDVAVPEAMQGTSLVDALAQGRAAPDRRPSFSTLDTGRVQRTEVVRFHGWKLLRTRNQNGVRHELYNLEQDPAERRNLFPDQPVRAHALEQLLDLHHIHNRLSQVGAGATINMEDLDPAVLESLRQLGYIDDG